MGSSGKKKIHAVAWEKKAELMNQFFFLAWVKNVAAATVSETLSNLYPPDCALRQDADTLKMTNWKWKMGKPHEKRNH